MLKLWHFSLSNLWVGQTEKDAFALIYCVRHKTASKYRVVIAEPNQKEA